MIPEWKNIKAVLSEELEYCVEKCCNPFTDERERIVCAASITTCKLILSLEEEDPEMSENE